MTDFSILAGKTDADLAAAAKESSPAWTDALAQQTQLGVRAAAVGALDANPDHTAQAIALGAQTGVPADVAVRNLPEVRRKAYLDQVERVFAEEPALARWHMNPVNAQLTRDDLANIEKLPSLWRGIGDALRSVPGGAVTGTGGILSGLGDLYGVAENWTKKAFDAVGVPDTGVRLPWFADPAQILKRPGAAITGVGEAIAPPVERQNLVDKIGGAIGGFAPLLVAEVVGGPALTTTMMAGMGADQQAKEVQRTGKEGTPEGDASIVAGAAVNALLQRLGFEAMLHRVPTQMQSAFLAKLTDVTIAGGIQATQQMLLSATQNAVSKLYLDPNKAIYSPDQAAEDAIVGFTTGVVMRGGMTRVTPSAKIQQQRAYAGAAEADAASLDKLMTGAKETNLAARSPGKMSELLASLGGDRNVFVPADAVREYFQKLEPEEAKKQAAALGIEKQLPEALATGGDVVIPLHQYVAHAPEDMATAWREDIRLRSVGMSIKEAKEYAKGDQAKAKDLGETVAGRLEQTTRENQARDQVVAQVERQLQDAGESPEAARQIAQLLGERYATRAARSGRDEDATQAYKRSGVEFRSDLPEQIKHAPADELELLIRALKGKTDRSEANAQGPTILQAISRNGGIIDDGGELSARDVDKWHIGKPFQNKALRDAPQPAGGGLPGLTDGIGDRSRYSAERWAHRLWEDGFFPEKGDEPATTEDLYHAIEDELRGKPRRVEKADKPWVDDFHSAVRDLDEILTKEGIDARKASVDEIRAALEKMNAEGRTFEQESRGNITFAQNSSGETRSLITLFKDRNLSTVLHETGHLWLEELHDDARRSDAPQQLKDDLKLVRDWLGVKAGDVITVEQHEKWARAVEAYMMEGKSPTVGLSDTFARFKAWMVSIYKTVLSLRVQVSDEMRGVMDRLIATDEAIEEAKTEIGARQLFASADQAGMTEAEFKAYSDSVTRSRDKAEQAVLDKLMTEVRHQRTAEWKTESDAIREEVRPTVDTQPDMVALQYLRSGDLPDSLAHLRDIPRLRLSRDALIEEYGNPEIVNALPKSVPPLVTDHGGVRPGDIAEMLGFTDGRAMIDSLTALAKEQAALKAGGDKRSVRVSRIDAEVATMMKERHGDMLTDGSIEAEALLALHNDARSDVLASEVRALARKGGQEPTPYKLAREWAKRSIAEKAVGEVSDLSQYTRAEAKAAKLAEQALVKGDHDEALRRKQEQMIAHALWMEARDAKAEVETARKMMDRLAGTRTSKSMDQGYLEKIHDLLERFDLKARSLKAVEKSESLRDWADQQQAAGIDVAVPQKLLDEAYRQSYRRMSVEEFRGLTDSVKQLAHLGRMKQEFLDGKDKREFDAVVDLAVASAAQGRQTGDTATDSGKTNFQRRFGSGVSGVRSIDAALLKIEYLFKWLDGRKAGPFARLLQRISEAQSAEKTQWGDLGNKLHALFHEIPVETRRRMQDVATYPELNGEKLRRDALMSVALNMGNESNKAKMLKGHNWSEEGVLRAIDRGLGAEEMAFVQKSWDLIETLWPQIAALERRVNGVEPEKVEPSPLVTRHGTFKGGYFPLVYEPKRAAEKGDRPGALTAENFGSEIYTRATTPKGFTKERTDNFARPIHLSLEVIPQHLMEVVHDIHYREAIMDAQRFLNDARIKNAIREKIGPEYEGQMQPWLNHIAMEYAKDRQGMGGWDKAMKTLRTNVTMVGMGYRLTTIFSQIGGLSDSTAVIGPRWMASGATAYATHPIENTAFVRDKSGEMRHRAETLDRDIRQVSKTMSGNDSVLDPIRNFAYHGIGWADAAVTVPTWLGAYHKALHEGRADSDAVSYADGVVRQSQGAGGAKDLARIQRDGETWKLLTMFYSYFSHYYNEQRDIFRQGRDAIHDKDAGSFGNALARAFWLNGPGVLAAQLLAGQGPDKDESWGAWASRTMFFNAFMGVPVVRDLAQVASNAVAGKFVGGYQMSPVGKALETGTNIVIKDIPHLIQGKPADHALSHAISTMGYLTALPTGQLATTTQFLYDALWSKKANPQTVTDWMKGLVYGPPPKK